MAQNTISTRIALEGAQDVQQQLADIGTAGERAFGQIQSASGNTAALSGLSTVVAGIKDAFGSVGTALAPVSQRFSELEEAVKGVFENLSKTAEVFGVGLVAGLAGGIAGFAELIKSSAEAGHQLEIQAGVLGLTVEQLQSYQKVAAAAGISAEQVFTALSRLTQNVGKDNEKLTDDALKTLGTLPLAAQQVGVGVVQGVQPAGDAIKSHIITNIQASGDAAKELAPILLKALSPDVAKSINIGQRVQQLTQAGSAAGMVGEQFRNAVALLGVNFPVQTFGEQFARQALLAKDPLLAVGVTLKDLQAAGDNLDPIVLKVIDGLSKIADPAQKGQVGLALLGRGWKDIIGAFDGGAASILNARQALEASGLFLTKEQAATLADAEKALVALGGAATGLRNQLAVIFAPALTEGAMAFTELIKQNLDTLKGWAAAIASEVLPGISDLIKQFGLSGNAAKEAGDQAKQASILPAVVSGKTGAGVVQLPTAASPSAAAAPSAAAQASPEAGLPFIDTSSLQDALLKLNSFKETVMSIATTVGTAFSAIKSVLDGVAGAINAVFPTNFSGSGLAIAIVVGQLSGAFTLLLPLLLLAAALIAALGTPVIAFTALAIAAGVAIANWRSSLDGLRGAAAAVGEGITSDFGSVLGFITNLLGQVSGLIQDLVSMVAERVGPLGGLIASAFQTAIEAVANLIPNVFGGISDFIAGAVDRISGFLNNLLGFVSRIASAIGSLIGSTASAGQPADAGGLGLGFASGGQVRGRNGTDTVPAWLTAGEYVIRADAVRHYGSGLFHALNQMRMPFDDFRQRFSLGGLVDTLSSVHPAPALHFASGGLVPALAPAGGGGPLNALTLVLDGQNFDLAVEPGKVFDKLSRHARSSAIRSAGRKPTWYGS